LCLNYSVLSLLLQLLSFKANSGFAKAVVAGLRNAGLWFVVNLFLCVCVLLCYFSRCLVVALQAIAQDPLAATLVQDCTCRCPSSGLGFAVVFL
jgi:hypothetical protein